MPGQGRLGDKANVALDAHGCPACPHPAIGPAIQGSRDVNVNRRPALRVDDPGIHAACCGANTWTATKGSLTVFINGKGAHRMGDQNRHCGGLGQLIEGSPNVLVGESDGRAEQGEAASAVWAAAASRGESPYAISAESADASADSAIAADDVAQGLSPPTDAAAQAAVLKAAARNGVPFCAQCEQLRAQRAQREAAVGEAGR